MTGDVAIRPARGDVDIDAARALFSEYADWLAEDHGISLAFQGIDEELATLPGKYAKPKGDILLAWRGTDPLGSVAVRPFDEKTCEVKRLFVRAPFRGSGLGMRLTSEIVDVARGLGYTRALLDTAGFMDVAQRVYENAGFTDIPAYYHNPVPGVRYLGRDL